MIDAAGIVEHVSWAESVAVASFSPTSWCDRDDLRGYAAEALVVLSHIYDETRGTFGGFVRSRLKYAIIDLLRRDFGRSATVGPRSVCAVRSIDADRERMNRSEYAAGGYACGWEPEYLARDEHVDDDAVDRVYAAGVRATLDRSGVGGWVLAETARGRSLADVGRELGVTGSRACQLRTRARKRILAQLAY